MLDCCHASARTKAAFTLNTTTLKLNLSRDKRSSCRADTQVLLLGVHAKNNERRSYGAQTVSKRQHAPRTGVGTWLAAANSPLKVESSNGDGRSQRIGTMVDDDDAAEDVGQAY